MKKFIILLCVLFVATAAFAETRLNFINYGEVKLAVQADVNQADNPAIYGLYKNGKQLLPAKYEVVYNEDLKMFVFYADSRIFLFDTNGKKIFAGETDFPIDKDCSVELVPVKAREDVPCYELMAYFFNTNWGGQSFGTFFAKGGHIYRILRPKAELMN